MSVLTETYTLSNGTKIPKLGLGTWFIEDDKAAEAVRQAVKLGYRHIDTAQAYGNERGVGEGVCTCNIPREQLFVTTKLAAELKNYEAAAMAEKYHVTIPQLCIRYALQLETVPLPKTANPEHMKENAAVDFAISDEDMEVLKNVEHLKDYGSFSMFPVFSGK